MNNDYVNTHRTRRRQQGKYSWVGIAVSALMLGCAVGVLFDRQVRQVDLTAVKYSGISDDSLIRAVVAGCEHSQGMAAVSSNADAVWVECRAGKRLLWKAKL